MIVPGVDSVVTVSVMLLSLAASDITIVLAVIDTEHKKLCLYDCVQARLYDF